MDKEFIKCWLKWVGFISLGLFIVGPIFILFGKYMEWFSGLIGL